MPALFVTVYMRVPSKADPTPLTVTEPDPPVTDVIHAGACTSACGARDSVSATVVPNSDGRALPSTRTSTGSSEPAAAVTV